MRDLNTGQRAPQKSWAGQHLTYTHGYGAIVAPANAKEPSGEPRVRRQGRARTSSEVDELAARPSRPSTSARTSSSYVVMGTKQQRDRLPGGRGHASTRPTRARTACELDNPLKRAAFALRFGDAQPADLEPAHGRARRSSTSATSGSGCQALAPFLHFDADPYPVILDGRILWIVDAYTTTDRYPYAQRADTEQLADGSGLDHGFNYVRNSVKAVVDAYDGTVDFYVMPVDDPIIEAYRDAFPTLFTDFEEMPDGPEGPPALPGGPVPGADQHVGPLPHRAIRGSFYEGNDYWDVARDPGTAGAGGGHQRHQRGRATRSPRRATPASTRTTCSPSSPAPTSPEFILLRPFVPTSREDDSQLLTAFMVGKSDGDDYGKLQVFVMPRGQPARTGPRSCRARSRATREVSRAGDAARPAAGSDGAPTAASRPSRSTAASCTCGRSTSPRRRPRCPASRR